MVQDTVLSEALVLLRRAGVRISGGNLESLSLTLPNHAQVTVRVHPVDAPPPPAKLRSLLERPERILIVSRRNGRAVDESARDNRMDLITLDPASVVIGGRQQLDQDEKVKSERAQRHGRAPWGRWAMERALVLSPAPMQQQHLADSAAISQPAVAKHLKNFTRWVHRVQGGWEVKDKRALLLQWLEDYPGPRGASTYWYSLDPLPEQAIKAASFAAFMAGEPLVSGDMAADVYAPWHLPDHVHIYVRQAVDLTDAGFIPASRGEATLTLTIPQDPTLWATAAGSKHPGDLPLADPLIVLQDLRRSEAVDSTDAVAHFLEVIARGGTRWRPSK